MKSLTILLVHGAWMNSTCWENFKARYTEEGQTVVTASWPHLSDDVTEARAHPDPALTETGLREIVDRYAQLAASLPEPPVLVGHSFGGLVVQLLLDRGVGVAGVAIDSAPPKGVHPSWSAARASLGPALGAHKLHTMSLASFGRDFANATPEALRAGLYERYVVPSPGLPFSQLTRGSAAGVNWENPNRAPLLLIAGEEDRTVTSEMNHKNWELWKQSPATTDFVELPGRDHSLIVGPGWEEVADTALSWLMAHTPDAVGAG